MWTIWPKMFGEGTAPSCGEANGPDKNLSATFTTTDCATLCRSRKRQKSSKKSTRSLRPADIRSNQFRLASLNLAETKNQNQIVRLKCFYEMNSIWESCVGMAKRMRENINRSLQGNYLKKWRKY
ncbi:hypothetical protein A2183_02690 [Candidatus Nomurabacteria bacterium RIFOXYA1_FULL_42_12]|nr:MAG: hypothetical protein A2183_02690 [Candidatus Nomurabacteria bacterium RIFOXYA1_FULL_42_12]